MQTAAMTQMRIAINVQDAKGTLPQRDETFERPDGILGHQADFAESPSDPYNKPLMAAVYQMVMDCVKVSMSLCA